MPNGAALLDVNVLVALLDTGHVDHERAQSWFETHAASGWATCAITEAGYVRVTLSHSTVSDPIGLPDVLAVLAALTDHPSHQFWTAPLGVVEAVAPLTGRIRGYRQITDAYLLGLALHHAGRLVTLDAGIRHLLPPTGPHLGAVELL